jgi:hypothetical protein
MREFKALNPKNLPDGFDLEVHTEEPVVEVKESKGIIAIDYAFPGFYLADDDREVDGKKMELRQIHIKSTGFFTESGKPLLPSFGRYVQIPHNCDFKVAVQKSQPVQFDKILVSPAQTQLSDNPKQKHEFEYDKEFYTKDVLYPEEIVKVTGPFSVDQYRVLLVHVTPLQYNPAKKKVVGYGNVTVTIDLKEKKGGETKQATDSIINNDAFGNLLLNPGQRIAKKVGFEEGPIAVFPITGPSLLIIYAKIFENAAKKLAVWKNRRGLITETVCVDTIGNDVNKLKTYIRGQRGIAFTRLRYLLLFGDVDMIVTQSDLQSMFGAVGFLPAGDRHSATDYYYSTRYDENTPDPTNPNGKLFYPWLSVGRIPVRPDVEGPPASGDSQGKGVVDQIIAYEKNPPADSAYYTRQVFAAYFEDDTYPTHDKQDDRGYLRTIEEIRTAIASLGYATERVYTTNDAGLLRYDDGTNIPADVKAAMVNAATGTQMLVDATTEGQLYIGHRDHGNWDGWLNPSFKNSDLDSVTGDIPSIFYSINCETGAFDYPEPTECWAEKNLRLKGAAPSLIAATRDSGTFRNNALIRAIFDATFGGVLSTFPGGNASYPVKNNRLGDILNYGKSYLPVAFSGDVAGVKDHFEIYHVIGDPTLECWKNLPLVITIKATILQKPRALDIQLSSCPAGAVLTIWYGNKLLKRMEPASTHITIPLTGLVPFPKPIPVFPRPGFSICFWAPGYRYTEVKVTFLWQ